MEQILNVVHHCFIYLKQIVKHRSGRGQLVYAHGIHSGFVVRFGCSRTRGAERSLNNESLPSPSIEDQATNKGLSR